jgi:uncharacterized membrane protein YidH (DUF202 family)
MEPRHGSDRLADEFEKVQLLLAEKRTALSLLRTGIALLTLPLSVVSILIATSHYYESSKVLYLLIPVLAISVILLLLGSWIVGHSFRKYRALEQKIREVKIAHAELKNLIT